MRKKFCNLFLTIACFMLSASYSLAAPNNLHLIDEDKNTGFQIYRSGRPYVGAKRELRKWCRMGISEVFVLSGNGDKVEIKKQKACPGLKVQYDERQYINSNVTTDFLRQFDEWVLDAQAKGKKILFRCNCGCHRTGRLAAYYRMRFNQWSAQDAIQEMLDLGKFMKQHPMLPPQVRALEEYILGKPCSQLQKHCVVTH